MMTPVKCAYTRPIGGLTKTYTSQNTKHKKGFNVNILCAQETNCKFYKWTMKCKFNVKETLYYVANWTCWLSHTVIQDFFHSDLTIYYMDMTAPHKQEQEHRLRYSHTTHCIQMWVPHLIVEIKNHLPSMLTHGLLYLIHTTNLYSNGMVTVSTDRNSFPATPLNNNYQLRPTHLMDTKINHHEESHCLGHSDLNKTWKSGVTVTVPQVILTLAWMINPTAEGLPHSKLWHPLGQ